MLVPFPCYRGVGAGGNKQQQRVFWLRKRKHPHTPRVRAFFVKRHCPARSVLSLPLRPLAKAEGARNAIRVLLKQTNHCRAYYEARVPLP